MAIKKLKINKGYALLIAVIFMSVLLALGLSLTSLGYKQSLLSSTGTESQYAFYAADSVLECALSIDQLVYPPGSADFSCNPFSYQTHGELCNGNPQYLNCTQGTNNIVYAQPDAYDTIGQKRITTFRIPLSLSDPNNPNTASRCADLTVTKTAANNAGDSQITVTGYNVPCTGTNSVKAFEDGNSGIRIVARSLQATY